VRVDASGNIHVFFDDSTPGNAEIFHKKSTDSGVNWMTRRITWNSGNSMDTDVFIDTSGHFHLVWYDNTPGNTEIFFKKSTNGGATWAGAKRLSWNSGASGEPRIAVDGSGHAHVVWHDHSTGNAEIFYTKSTDGGTTWASRRMTWSDSSVNPAILVDTLGNIHVFWSQGSMMKELYFSTSTDGGTTWGGAKRLTWNSGYSSNPAIATDSNNHIHVVWGNHYKTGNDEIFHKKSTNGGASWVSKRISWIFNSSLNPVVGVDSNDQIHLVWQDAAPGNWEILYRKGIQ